MKLSTDRILTTHAGSLSRPETLLEANRAKGGAGHDASAFAGLLSRSVVDVCKAQSEAGVDVINDGEFGKTARGTIDYGPWQSYAYERMTGWEHGKPGDVPPMSHRRDWLRFSDFYAELSMSNAPIFAAAVPLLFTGPIVYTGQAALQADLDNLRAGMAQTGATEGFVTAVAPGSFGRGQNRYYATEEQFLEALAEALRVEYRAIVDAGFVLQLDDPGLPDSWDRLDPAPTVEEYRRYAGLRIDALNHALRDLPEDRIRYHICWGSWHGPHTTDLPLRDIVDVMLSVNAGAYSVEAGNVRHEHDWKVWQDTKLPEGKALIPGVVSHATNVVEHPELVADRIVRYAGLVGRENVIAGTDCGFGGRIHPQLAWAKLAVLSEGAALASRELWGSGA